LKIDELIIYRYDGTSLALSHLDTLSKDAKASANKVNGDKLDEANCNNNNQKRQF